MSSSPFSIGVVRVEEIPLLPGIEARAASIFPSDLLPPEVASHVSHAEGILRAQVEDHILVARDAAGRVLGFVRCEELEGYGVLGELDVDPSEGRRGIGRALVEAACKWSKAEGHGRIVLSTFRDIAWNAPFYSSAGFREIAAADWTPGMTAMRKAEGEMGFDLEKRILMERVLPTA